MLFALEVIGDVLLCTVMTVVMLNIYFYVFKDPMDTDHPSADVSYIHYFNTYY